MEQRLEGKVALVTGAGSGIGRGVALRLGGEGAAVVVADLDRAGAEGVAAEVARAGGTAEGVRLDVSRPEELRALVDQVVRARGHLDVLVNSAGVVLTKGFLEVTEADWDRVIDVNQKGTAFAIQAVAAHMASRVPQAVKDAGRADRCYGKIVNITSISGRRGRDYQMAYAASKAAIISLTQSAALAFAPLGINVNAIAPSVVMTPMWEQNNREKERLMGIDARRASDEFIARIPMRRAGTVEEMAAAVAFLCSPDADYVTGQTVNVDGGYEMD
jgi:NAD(P)-dependent dehydrogenase (short-subunit alcohol dehydrogenase family)